jgi:hypothetical protein
MKRYLIGGPLGLVGGSLGGLVLGVLVLFVAQALRIMPHSHGNDQLLFILLFAVVGTILIGALGLMMGLAVAAMKRNKE